MVIWTLAKKELRILTRDRLSVLILLGMPLLFILLLGLLLGEGFGQKPDDRLRISIVNLDRGLPDLNGLPDQGNGQACFIASTVGQLASSGSGSLSVTAFLAPEIPREKSFPYGKWSDVVIRDLRETSSIRVEMIPSVEEAKRLVSESKRAAVVVFRENFSQQVHECSFLAEGINPFYRDGVLLEKIGVDLLQDKTQTTGANVNNQIIQVTLLRVLLPYMIGEAFEEVSDPEFIRRLGSKVKSPKLKFGFSILSDDDRRGFGEVVQKSLGDQFPKYNLTGKTWAALTKSTPRPDLALVSTIGQATSPVSALTNPVALKQIENELDKKKIAEVTVYQNQAGIGAINRGAARYQILVPSYTVMFAFSLVLTVGWLFVVERKQHTLTRLRAAPITRTQVLIGKFIPCFFISVVQGMFLLLAGKLIFGMNWGPSRWPIWQQILNLMPVILTTSLAAMGMAMFVAALTRTEMQVALIGSLLVLMLALLSGCLIPREILPEEMIEVSRITPHAWALDAYRQLLVRPENGTEIIPNMSIVRRSCMVLSGYGIGFLFLGWSFLRLR